MAKLNMKVKNNQKKSSKIISDRKLRSDLLKFALLGIFICILQFSAIKTEARHRHGGTHKHWNCLRQVPKKLRRFCSGIEKRSRIDRSYRILSTSAFLRKLDVLNSMLCDYNFSERVAMHKMKRSLCKKMLSRRYEVFINT